MKSNVVRKTITTALLSVMAIGGFAQDLIAHQAPSDKRLREVRNVKLNGLTSLSTEDLQNPAANIYTDWTNGGVSTVSGHVGANFKIDLRGFSMPTPSRKINSKFGPRWGKLHAGLDIKVYVGDTIYAAFDGKVRIVKFNARGYGYYVVIRHPNGLETLYGHLSKQLVKEDQIVKSGEPIGLGGSTGKSSGSHLHFETRLLGQPINPAFMFDFENQDVTGDYYVARTGAMTKGKAVARTSATLNIVDNAENQTEEVAASSDATEQAKDVTTVEEPKEDLLPAVTSKKNASKSRKSKSVTYRVKDGDNLYTIARRHGLTVDKLCKLNGIKSTTIIHKGLLLKCS